MNRKARKTIATVTLLLILGLAGYAGALVTSAHDRTVARSNRVIDLGTIMVTPEDALPGGAARAHRYAARTQPYDATRHSI